MDRLVLSLKESCESRGPFSKLKFHGLGTMFLSFKGIRSIAGFEKWSSPRSSCPSNDMMDILRLLRWASSGFFLTVLKAKGEAAANRSWVLIGGPRSTLVKESAGSNWGLNIERGVMAGLGSGNIGRGVSSCDCDHGRGVPSIDEGNVLS
jgi:hypothetical protein